MDIIDHVHAKDYYFVIHADYESLRNNNQLSKIPEHSKINHYIAVSKRAAEGFKALTGKICEVCYNPFTPQEPKKVLRLISATRLSKEKGKDRIIKFAEMLDKAGIKYIWTIFTNDKNAINNPNIIYMKPRLDILDYIADSDYLVQLSDNEGFCYSVVEALTAGVPVIVTPCPVFDEIGLVDGKNCYKINFDMSNFSIDKILNIPKNFNYQPPKDNWNNIFIQKPSTWAENKNKKYIVKALPTYEDYHLVDAQLGRIPKRGDIWEVNYERMLTLTGENEKHLKFVTIIEEIPEKK